MSGKCKCKIIIGSRIKTNISTLCVHLIIYVLIETEMLFVYFMCNFCVHTHGPYTHRLMLKNAAAYYSYHVGIDIINEMLLVGNTRKEKLDARNTSSQIRMAKLLFKI